MRISFINRLIDLLEERNLEEIEIRRFGTTIRLRKNSQGKVKIEHPDNNPVQKLDLEEEKKTEGVKSEEKTVSIKAPMVGTFYRAPAPDAPPYIDVGDKVTPGRVVCLVEAMKILNEIESDVRGTIVDILVKNEDPVEYNQELFLVKPE